jgi:hypothetical protein
MLDSMLKLVFAGRTTIPPPEDLARWETTVSFLLNRKVIPKPVPATTCFWRR